MRFFADEVCSQIGLPTLKKVIEHYRYDVNPVQRYIKNVSQGISDEVRVIKDISESAQEYHKKLYKLMFVIPLKNIPKYIDEEAEFKPAILWRLRIAQ